MSVIAKTVSIAANARVPDQLVVDAIMLQQRTAQMDGAVDMALTATAIGLEIDTFVGAKLGGQGYEPVVKATAPILPDDVVGSFGIRAGQQISMSVFNTTGGPITLFYKLQVPG